MHLLFHVAPLLNTFGVLRYCTVASRVQAAVADQLAAAGEEGEKLRNLLRPALAHPAKQGELDALDENEQCRQRDVDRLLAADLKDAAEAEESALAKVQAQFTATTDHLLKSFDT